MRMLHHAEVPMDEKYPEDIVRLLDTWVDCVAGLDKAFNADDPNEKARPLAGKQLRYFYASLAVARLLQANGHKELAHRFVELAEAFHDKAEGIDHPLFALEQGRRPGAQPDTSAVWRIRANICVAMKYLMAGGKTEVEAIKAALQYGKAFERLTRADSTGLLISLGTWLKSFASDKAPQVALTVYKDGVADITNYQLSHTGKETQEKGEKLLRGAAALAADLPSKPNRHSDS
jgi:hypothetical protein